LTTPFGAIASRGSGVDSELDSITRSVSLPRELPTQQCPCLRDAACHADRSGTTGKTSTARSGRAFILIKITAVLHSLNSDARNARDATR
jgi:hypothetical protein